MLSISLKDKVALVVGGSRGIGKSITEFLAKAGAKVIFTHTGNPGRKKELEKFIESLKREGLYFSSFPVDACDDKGMEDCVARIIKTYDKIDILVHNAGKNLARPAEEVSTEEWHRFLDINLTSAFISIHCVLPFMLKVKYGRIILIGSSAVYDGGGGAIDYAAGKSGLTGIMTYLTKAYARKGILTNIIHPCVIETDLLKERYADEKAKAELIKQIPAGRLGQPEDIAGLVAYLASSWGDYICGQAILVDGGRTMY
jgi:NAD(P)-dependent dehydrogenase (short-subunit alcohol dehydrogenase family)